MHVKSLIKNLNNFADNFDPAFFEKKIVDFNPLSGQKKTRNLNIPNDDMRRAHLYFRGYLHGLKVNMSHVYGLMPGCSALRNVQEHANQRFLLVMDIKNFYPSITEDMIFGVLTQLDSNIFEFENEFRNILRIFVLTSGGVLAIGANSSPLIANIVVAVNLDHRLAEYCRHADIRYTRYLDDLLFSSKKSTFGRKRRQAIRNLVRESGLDINESKTRAYDLQKGPVVINGIGLEYGGRTFLPRHVLRKIKGRLYSTELSKHQINGMKGLICGTTKGKYQKFNKTETKVLKLLRKKLK